MQRLNQELWNGLVDELGDAGARIAMATYGPLYTDEEIAAKRSAAKESEVYVSAIESTIGPIEDAVTFNEMARINGRVAYL